jgi:hypothetical protein
MNTARVAILFAAALTATGCAHVAERAATRWAAPLGQAADVGTTAYALFLAEGFREANPLLAGANGLSAVGAAIVLAKPIVPALVPSVSQGPACRTYQTVLGMAGWGAAGWNTAVLSGAAASGGLAAGVGAAILLWPWLDASAEQACVGIRKQ